MIFGSSFRKLFDDPTLALKYPRNKLAKLYDGRIWPYFRGTNIFELDWDLCVVLDACRVDMARAASRRHNWLPVPETYWSVGSNSPTWYRRTVRGAGNDQIRESGLVSANPYTPRVKDAPWKVFDEVWRYAFNDEYGTTLPRPVTDRAIKASRDQNVDRLLVHYMQPHMPPVHTQAPHLGWDADKLEWVEGDPWNRAANGDLNSEYVEQLYRENLDPVLEDVELLLDNVDANRVIITADHGNYLGEGGKWSHPDWERGAPVRRVPLWTMTATDSGSHDPVSYKRDAEVTSRTDQLEALGYT
jgi:hypothetical protein